MILPVILAGGSGTRLWPLSRTHYPKQFLTLDSHKSLLQQTLLRLSGLRHLPPLIICNEQHRFITLNQIHQLNVPYNGLLLEPTGRNTAPAIAIAAIQALQQGSSKKQQQVGDPILLVLPADHIIDDNPAFLKAIEKASLFASRGKFVTFGIDPKEPETGYGYIKKGNIIEKDSGIYAVQEFVEKPDLASANQFLAQGGYYWNSGIFMFRASSYLDALNQFRPDIYASCKQAMQNPKIDGEFIRADSDAFTHCASDSIDYAVMEPLCALSKANTIVVPLNTHWSDIGSFAALWKQGAKDDNGNVLTGDVKAIDTKNSLIISQDKLTVTLGVDNLVVINTKDAVLVASKDNPQSIKLLVETLINQGRSEPHMHREVFRPWGKYDLIDTGNRFQAKRITVNVGAKLSLQMHRHRAEHWVVVSGFAKVTIAKETRYLAENESTFIPQGCIHALENAGEIPLELIEVQSGRYLDEDDIVRFEDKYGRETPAQ